MEEMIKMLTMMKISKNQTLSSILPVTNIDGHEDDPKLPKHCPPHHVQGYHVSYEAKTTKENKSNPHNPSKLAKKHEPPSEKCVSTTF